MLDDKEIVKYTPILTTVLLESAAISQMIRMFREGAADDQSLLGWIMIWCALLLWFNWYRVFTPEQKFAKWSTIGGMVINTLGIASIVWFRWLS